MESLEPSGGAFELGERGEAVKKGARPILPRGCCFTLQPGVVLWHGRRRRLGFFCVPSTLVIRSNPLQRLAVRTPTPGSFFFHTHPARRDNATPHGAALTPSLSSFTSSCSKPATLVYTRFLPASHPCFPPLSPLNQRRLGCHCAALTASDQKNCPKAAHCVGKLHDSLQVPGSVPEVVDVRYSVPPRSSRRRTSRVPTLGGLTAFPCNSQALPGHFPFQPRYPHLIHANFGSQAVSNKGTPAH